MIEQAIGAGGGKFEFSVRIDAVGQGGPNMVGLSLSFGKE